MIGPGGRLAVLVLLGALLVGCAPGNDVELQPPSRAKEVVTVFGHPFEARTMGKPHSFAYTADSARFEVRPGERYYATDARQRAELTECPLRSRLLTDPLASSFKVRVTGDVAGSSTIIYQVHQDRVPGREDADVPKPPTLAIGFNSEGDFTVGVRGDSQVPASVATRQYTQIYNMPWTHDAQWVSVAFEAHFGPLGSGSMRLWIDGRLVADRSDIVIGYASTARQNRPQVQFGIYRKLFTTPLIVEYRDVVIADPPEGPGCVKPTPPATSTQQ